MSDSAANTIVATLVYGLPPPDGERAVIQFLTSPDPVTGKLSTKNYSTEEKTVIIEDVRGKEDTVSLDTSGFQFFMHAPKLAAGSFSDETTVLTEYYPECIDLIKKLTGASRVEIYNHGKFLRRLHFHE